MTDILTTKRRNALPSSAFALPGRRYPIFDKDHAQDAKARADEMYKKGYLTKAEYDLIVLKANAVLRKAGVSEPEKEKA